MNTFCRTAEAKPLPPIPPPRSAAFFSFLLLSDWGLVQQIRQAPSFPPSILPTFFDTSALVDV